MVFSNESVLRIRLPNYWLSSFNISPSKEHSGLISYRTDWFDLLAVQWTLKSLQFHSLLVPGHLSVPGLKASILQPRFWPLFKKEIELFSTFRRPAMEAQRLPQGPIGIRAQEVHRHGTPSQKPCLGFPGIASR